MKPRHLALLLPLLLPACGQGEQVQKRDLLALGTIVQITLWGVDADKADEVLGLARESFHGIHREWHPWEQPGKLAKVNAALAAGQAAETDREFTATIRQAMRLMEKSGGLFNPMLGHITRLWGFHEDANPGAVPDERLLAEWLDNAPQASDLIIEDGTIRGKRPGLQLDLGAFIKGHAVDEVSERLRAIGIENAIVNAGGDLRAMGRRGARPWNIAIRHPRNNDALGSIETRDDESVFTSGDYERFFIADGKRYHHIIDPRTAAPATGAAAVTVVGSSAAASDAAVTALFVAGPGEWRQAADNMGVTCALLVDSAGNVHMTPDMAERFTMNEKYARKAF